MSLPYWGIISIKKNRIPKRNKRIAKSIRSSFKAESTLKNLASTPSFINTAENALGLEKAALPTAEPAAPPEPRKVGELIVMHIVTTPNRLFKGYELLQALLSAGLRFGEKKIFHRHETKNGRGPILFSLASMEKPGTFDMQKMGAFECKGLTLFMELYDHTLDYQMALDLMLETVKQLVEDLGGEVLDEHRHRLTIEKVTEWRRKVRAYEEAQRVPDLFGK